MGIALAPVRTGAGCRADLHYRYRGGFIRDPGVPASRGVWATKRGIKPRLCHLRCAPLEYGSNRIAAPSRMDRNCLRQAGNPIPVFQHSRLEYFSCPRADREEQADLTRCTEDILLAREAHFPATIAELYDPDNMPADLREAHERNDEVLKRIYIGRRFRNDTERLEKRFELYTKMSNDKKSE